MLVRETTTIIFIRALLATIFNTLERVCTAIGGIDVFTSIL